MLRQIYVSKNRLTGEHSDPFFCVNEEEAILRFKRGCVSSLYFRPSDFDLLFVGEYDSRKNSIIPRCLDNEEFILSGSDVWLEDELSRLILEYRESYEAAHNAFERLEQELKEKESKEQALFCSKESK